MNRPQDSKDRLTSEPQSQREGAQPSQLGVDLPKQEIERRISALEQRFKEITPENEIYPEFERAYQVCGVVAALLKKAKTDSSADAIHIPDDKCQEIAGALREALPILSGLPHPQGAFFLLRPVWKLAKKLDLDDFSTFDSAFRTAQRNTVIFGIENQVGSGRLELINPKRYRLLIDWVDEYIPVVGNSRTFLEEQYMRSLNARREELGADVTSSDPEILSLALNRLAVIERNTAEFYECRFIFERSRGHGDVEDLRKAYAARTEQLKTYEQRDLPSMRVFPLDPFAIGSLPDDIKEEMLTFASRAVNYLARRHVWDPARSTNWNRKAQFGEGLISRVFDTLRYFELHQDESFELGNLTRINDLRLHFFEGGLTYQMRAADIEWRELRNIAPAGAVEIATAIRIRYERFAEALDQEWLRDCSDEREAMNNWLRGRGIYRDESWRRKGSEGDRVLAVRAALPHLEGDRDWKMYSPHSFNAMTFWQPRVLVATSELPAPETLIHICERVERVLKNLPKIKAEDSPGSAAFLANLVAWRMIGAISDMHESYLNGFKSLQSIIKVMAEHPINPFAHVAKHLETAGKVAQALKAQLLYQGVSPTVYEGDLFRRSDSSTFTESVVLHSASKPDKHDLDFAQCEHWFGRLVASSPHSPEEREKFNAARVELVNIAIETHAFYSELLRRVHEGAVNSERFDKSTIKELEGFMRKAVEGGRNARKARLLSDLENRGVRDRKEFEEVVTGVKDLLGREPGQLALRESIIHFLDDRIKAKLEGSNTPTQSRYLGNLLCTSAVIWQAQFEDAKYLRDEAFNKIFERREAAVNCLRRADPALSDAGPLFEKFKPKEIIESAGASPGLGANMVKVSLESAEAINQALLATDKVEIEGGQELIRTSLEILTSISDCYDQGRLEKGVDPKTRVTKLAEDLVNAAVRHLPLVPEDATSLEMDVATRAARALGRIERLLNGPLNAVEFKGRDKLSADLQTYWLNICALAGAGTSDRLELLRQDARVGRE